tara:strand:- start:1760 stop:2035 length:276 start_codon:yes stop_codon:yes gene_type:complete
MKKLLTMTFLLPLLTFAEYEMKTGMVIEGKIASVKTSGKYASFEKCKSYAEKRTGIKAFTFDSKKDKCTLFKSIRGIKEDINSTSGMIKKS